MTTRILQWTVGLFLITGAAIAYGQGGAEVEAKQATSDRSKAEAELRATDLAWSAAASRKDVDATVAFMADDGETLPPNEPARWSPSVGSPGPGLVWIHSSTRNARWFFLRADWVVEKAVELLQVALPTVDQPGYVRAKYLEEFHVPHGTITGVLPVVYARDIEGHWHIVSGADPTTREPDSRKVFAFSETNSVAIEEPNDKTQTIDAVLNSVDPTNAVTHLTTATVVLVRLPTEDGKVPAEPEALFGIPQ